MRAEKKSIIYMVQIVESTENLIFDKNLWFSYF